MTLCLGILNASIMKKTKNKHEHRIVLMNPTDKSSTKVAGDLVSLLDDGFDIVSEQVAADYVVYILRKYHE